MTKCCQIGNGNRRRREGSSCCPCKMTNVSRARLKTRTEERAPPGHIVPPYNNISYKISSEKWEISPPPPPLGTQLTHFPRSDFGYFVYDYCGMMRWWRWLMRVSSIRRIILLSETLCMWHGKVISTFIIIIACKLHNFQTGHPQGIGWMCVEQLQNYIQHVPEMRHKRKRKRNFKMYSQWNFKEIMFHRLLSVRFKVMWHPYLFYPPR